MGIYNKREDLVLENIDCGLPLERIRHPIAWCDATVLINDVFTRAQESSYENRLPVFGARYRDVISMQFPLLMCLLKTECNTSCQAME